MEQEIKKLKTSRIYCDLLNLKQYIQSDGALHFFYGYNDFQSVRGILIIHQYIDGELEDSWLAPYYHNSNAQCKNPLTTYNNSLHVSRSSKGMSLYSNDMIKLRSEGRIEQTEFNFGWYEETITMSVEQLMDLK